MKTLRTFLEEYNTYRLNEVTVTYKCKRDKYEENIYLSCPESYNESDVQTYINDLWLNDLPSGQDHSTTFFGKNDTNIFDVYFEYDSIEHSSDEHHSNEIEFDSRKAVRKPAEDEHFNIFIIKGLKYIIRFDRFELLNDSDDDTIQKTLDEIFTATVSNESNKYPIWLELDTKDIKWQK